MRIRDADVRSYVDDGFLVADGVVDPPELDQLKADAVRFARGGYPVLNPVSIPDGASDEEAMASVLDPPVRSRDASLREIPMGNPSF